MLKLLKKKVFLVNLVNKINLSKEFQVHKADIISEGTPRGKFRKVCEFLTVRRGEV